MQATARDYVEHLNRSFFDGQLGPGIVDRLSVLPVDRADVRAFVERMFREMRRWGFPATEVSLMHAELLGSLLSRILPGTWQGRVPPITVSGRHKKLDELVRLTARSDGLGHTLIDIACGFPPMTTIDTADALPGWQITGIDRALPAYLVTDPDNNYAVFDREGRATYFQPVEATVDRWKALLENWDASRSRFEGLLQTLLAARAPGADRVEKDGASLDIDPVRAFERPGVRFTASNLEDASVPPADVVRCCNMLLYFDDAFRKAAMPRFAALMREGGLLICGTDWAHTIEARYFTYRKRGGRLAECRFAFSIDCLAPLAIVPWYTLHDDDREIEVLGTLVAALRGDRDFIERFMSRSDAIRAAAGLCPRGPDGYYLATIPEGAGEAWNRAGALSDQLAQEFGQEAAGVLGRAGWRSHVNPVGHIEVELDA
jgi:hypothetical protein